MRLLRTRNVPPLLVGALVCGGLGVVATADTPQRAALRLADGGAWLVHRPSGVLTHVNGLSGRADAAVPLAGAAGHAVHVVDDGGHLLAVDSQTGMAYRVDQARLAVTATLETGSPGARLYLADGDAYVVTPADATVQRVDPVHLTPVGAAVELRSVGGAGQTPDGTLWVTVPTEGAVVGVVDGVPGEPVAVASASADPVAGDLAVAVVGDVAAVVDRPARRVVVVRPGGQSDGQSDDGGPAGAVTLPAGGEITVPTTASDHQLPLLVAGEDPAAAGAVVTVSLDGDAPVVVAETRLPTTRLPDGAAAGFGAPIAHGGHVYLPRDALGELWDLDLATGRFGSPSTVVDPSSGDGASGTGASGDGARTPDLALFARDDQVWVDDQGGTAGAVVADGVVRVVSKNAEGLAGLGASDPPQPLPALPGPATSPAPDGSAEPPTTTPPGDGGQRPGANPPAQSNPPDQEPPATQPQPQPPSPTTGQPNEPPPPSQPPPTPPPPPTAQPTTAPPPQPTGLPSDRPRDQASDVAMPLPTPAPAPAPVPGRSGYWLAFSDGTVQAAGTATAPTGGTPAVPNRVVGVAASATGRGYWLVDAAGGIHPFGDAPGVAPHGTPGAVVAVAAAPTGGGFWTVTAAGQVTAFGRVADHGSPTRPVTDPVVGIAATATGGGYWVVDTAGRVQAFGDAAQPVATGAFRTSVAGIAATVYGLGYLVVAADGEVAVVESGRVRREQPNRPVPSRIVGVAATPTGAGYWLADASSAVLAAGDAPRFDAVDPAGRAAVGIAAIP